MGVDLGFAYIPGSFATDQASSPGNMSEVIRCSHAEKLKCISEVQPFLKSTT